MTEEPWQPFGLSDDERVEYHVLRDGVPATLREPLLAWIETRLRYGDSGAWLSRSAVLDLQNVCRVDLGVTAGAQQFVDRSSVVAPLRQQPPSTWLRLTDYLASLLYSRSDRLAALDKLLRQGGSRWMVGERQGRPGLVERVPQGVQDAVEGIIDSAGSAGRLLARAWSDVHALDAQDSAAYASAVKAVEGAAQAVVMPNKLDATLGNIIGQMQADGDWRLPLREGAKAPSADVVVGMLRTLWVGHRDRHGGQNYSDVSHEEARVAVTLAATLVDWFAAGLVQRRPG